MKRYDDSFFYRLLLLLLLSRFGSKNSRFSKTWKRNNVDDVEEEEVYLQEAIYAILYEYLHDMCTEHVEIAVITTMTTASTRYHHHHHHRIEFGLTRFGLVAASNKHLYIHTIMTAVSRYSYALLLVYSFLFTWADYSFALIAWQNLSANVFNGQSVCK